MNQIREGSERAIEQKRIELQNQLAANMESVRNDYRSMEAQRNRQIEQLRQEQAGLNQQLAAANQKFEELRNRPRKFILSEQNKLIPLYINMFGWKIN